MRSAIIDELGATPTMAKTLCAAAKLDQLADDVPVVRWAVLRNFSLEPGLPAALKIACARSGMRAEVQLGEFDAAQSEALDSNSFLYSGTHDIVVLAQRLQTLAPRLVHEFASLTSAEIDRLVDSTIERVVGIVRAVRERLSIPILVHNFELPLSAAFGVLDPQLERGQHRVIRGLNLELARRMAQMNSAYIIDVDQLLSAAGYEPSLDDRYWHIGRAPYTFAFIERLARQYVVFAAALRGKSKKCLVLDCDNTLWGGVISEDGINGIALGVTHPGSGFLEFQSAILTLHARGVLLALNSKNNEDDVFQVLEGHPNSLLKPRHFVSTKVNWNDKVRNLQEISSELNIGLDSLVFVDDNPFECQFVRETLPEVTVIELPGDATRYARMLLTLNCFDTLSLSDEDRCRSEMYRSEAARSELRAATSSLEQYLASLDMVLTISAATPFSIPRIAQLTQKTNQFNLTTRRYDAGDVERMIADPNWRVYFAELEDKFDKTGVIAVAFVHDTADTSRIDTFLRSCRVIGRGVESALLAHIMNCSSELSKKLVVGEFIRTAKNAQVENFYANAGFSPRPGSDGRLWDCRLSEGFVSPPAWFSEIRRLHMMVAS